MFIPLAERHIDEIMSIGDAPGFDPSEVVARPLLEGSQCNVRIIRQSPGQELPPHTHGVSDLMIYAVEGDRRITTDAGPVAFVAGSLAYYRGDEELRVATGFLDPRTDVSANRR